jgi:hypothetical protein
MRTVIRSPCTSPVELLVVDPDALARQQQPNLSSLAFGLKSISTRGANLSAEPSSRRLLEIKVDSSENVYLSKELDECK